MTKWILCIFFSCSCLLSWAQQANYRLAEEMKTNSMEFGYECLRPEFVPKSDNFWFRMITDDGEKYYFTDVKTKKTEELFDREYIAVELGKITGRSYDPKKLGFWMTPFKEDGVTMYWRDGAFNIEYNRKTGKLSSSKVDPSKEQGFFRPQIPPQGLSPDGKYQVFGRRYNLYLRSLPDSTEVQLTFDGEPDFSYVNERDDDEEVGVVTVWASDSKRFYHYRNDTRDIGEVGMINYLRGRPSVGTSQVVLAGDTGVIHLELSLFDVERKEKIKVNNEKWKDQACRVLHTSPDLQKFYIERKKRTNDVLEICRVDVETGEVEVLIHEECKPYIGIELNSIHFLNDGEEIVMWSERSGYGHLYRYAGNGKLLNAITTGEWSAGHVVRIDEKKREIYFQAYGIAQGENPSYAKICKARLDGKGKITVLTPEEGTHTVQFFPSGHYIIDTYSRPDLVPQFNLRDMEGKLVMKLGESDVSKLYKKGWKLPETFSVKAADGETDLYGVMWKPFDFDPNRKYPVISCVYPGPHTDNVPLSFEFNSANELLAQVGFIVVAFNHRGGVPYRGRDYHTFGYGNIRDHALEDDKRGLEQLIERYNFIDGERVGVYGHSGGGFMSTALICTYPDFYKAAVSSAGNHDNSIYSQFFVETHHGVREVNREVQVQGKTADGRDTTLTRTETFFEVDAPSNIELAKNLKGHLMLVVGGIDGNVHPANTFRMLDAFICHGKDVEFVYLPQGRHTYDGVSEWYFQHKLWSHFGKYLLEDFSTSCFYDIEFDEKTYRLKRVE